MAYFGQNLSVPITVIINEVSATHAFGTNHILIVYPIPEVPILLLNNPSAIHFVVYVMDDIA